MAEAVLDPSVMEVLRSLTPPGEPDVLKEVLGMFVAEVPGRLEKLRNAHAGGDIELIHRTAHSLKGSAGNIGANAMFAVCKELDEKSRAGDAAAVGPLIQALAVEYDRVAAEISRLIAG